MPASLRNTNRIPRPIAQSGARVVNKRVYPGLTGLLRGNQADRRKWGRSRICAIEEYLARAREQYCRVAHRDLSGSSRPLEDWYLPLKVRASTAKKPIIIDHFNKRLFSAHKPILLIGPPGTGKTMLLRFTFLACLKENGGIPFFVKLGRLSSKTTVWDVIRQELSANDHAIDNRRLARLVRYGGFVFLLDGLNEIVPAHREKVIAQILDFISMANRNHFILAVRPDTPRIPNLDFQSFTIEPLALAEAFELMRRHDGNGALSRYIITKVERNPSKHLRRFLTNPLRVSMLYKSYELMRRHRSTLQVAPNHTRRKQQR